ncbi:SDR family NAD(P)-dependent oxidoreductase [Solimonas sp. K1W22B-7]|uniref:SDR family NAD(P)-dependent oxidoreductase n=1 Tax=Solimonas sp. K1W22B-7 TaxID=2303331 RepID=UPI000E32D509|nr:SDR family NAD(P)-dependent oxidoreductase [Solimonas sp. K1W22B-7]AXQ27777.1 SDR family NAD(P)-dependent oxidoreductase [Solimonas sp. K1W22B-7]
MIKDFRNKLCVITGGSSGIGLAVAEALAREGARLLLLARDPAQLERAAQQLREMGAADVATISADVSRDEDIARLPAAIHAMGPAADLVVNSAGIVSGGLMHEVPMAEWRRLHEINVLGVVRVINAVVPDMLARSARGEGGGHIVNIASGAGLVGFTGLGSYVATKAAVVGFSESLRSELAAAGIGVTAVCPGFVQTPIASKVQLFGRMDTPRTQAFIQNWFVRNNLKAETVAARTLSAVRANRAVMVVGRDAVSGYWTKRLAPWLLDRVMKRSARPLTAARKKAA